MTLPDVPAAMVSTRRSLHQLAYFVLAPARFRRTGRMGLVPTTGGFGTPDLGGRILRIDGDLLVDETDDAVATRTITTVREAAQFFGEPYEVAWFDGFKDELAPYGEDVTLEVDGSASRFVGSLFDLGRRVIDRFAEAVPDGITEVWIWPEHLDLATEAGNPDAGQKASYGVSPGDDEHEEPYFYVSAWGEINRSEHFWNDRAFNGASLPYRDLLDVRDPVAAVVEFFVDGFSILRQQGD